MSRGDITMGYRALGLESLLRVDQRGALEDLAQCRDRVVRQR